MSDEGGGPEDGTSVVVVSGDDYSSAVQLQTMESHDLPTELTTADLENLANNPSLWLNLDGSLVGNTELSTLQATEIPSVDIDGLSSVPATITLENMSETEMGYVGVDSLEEEIIHSQENIETMEISSATEEQYVQDIECSMEVEIGAHEDCEAQAPQIVLKPPTPVQQTVTIPSKKTAATPTQYILNQSTGQTILFTSKPSASAPAPITLPATAGATQSFRLISPAKTLTLAQAQQMGLISPKKGQTLVVNKLAIPSVTKPAAQQGIKPLPVTIVKSGPAKIAPAPPTPGSTAVTLIGGGQQPIIITANPVSSSQLIMKSSSTPIRMVTAISPNKAVPKPQTGTTFSTARAPGITPTRPNTPTTHYIRIPASQALAAGLVPAGPQLQLASGAGKQIQLVRLVGSAGVSPNKGPRTVLQSTQVRHIAPLPGTQTIVRMASPHQAGTVTKTVVPKGASVSTASRLLLSATSLMGGTNNGNVVMLPASVLSSSFVTQASTASGIMTTAASRVATATTLSSATQIKPKEPVIAKATSAQQSQLQQQSAAAATTGQPAAPQIRAIVESNGLRPRKPCNCTKSQCLKLYCDCFANGEFCYQCNCVNCFNNLSHEEERQKSIKQCLDRNPNAFRPKIGKSSGDSRRHNKGCHCKRSGCLKNYCECYEAKISCTDACRCIGCKNIDECGDRKPLKEAMDLEPRLPTPANRVKIPVSNADAAASHDYLSNSAASATPGSTSASRGGGAGVNTVPGSNVGARPAFSFVTQEVVEATCQCLLARAEEAQEAGKNVADTQLLVLEEFGRCLLQIIDYANKAKGSPS